MKYLIALALVTLAYADPIYYKTSGVAQLPAGARAASPYFLYKWAGANAAPATAATPGYPLAITADDAMNLNAAAKVLALDQASIGAPSSYAPASYAPAMQAFAPAAARVYTASALPALDAAASGFSAAVEAEDSLAKALAMEQANFGAASSYAPYYKSAMAAAPSSLASARLVAVTEFAPAATRVFAPSGAAAAHAIHALNSATPMTGLAPVATRVFATAGAPAHHALNSAVAVTEFAPAASRVFTPAGAAAIHGLNPATPLAEFAPAASRVFTPAGAAAIHGLNPAAPLAEFAPAASHVFTPAGAAAIHGLNAAAAMTEFAPAATHVFAPAGVAATHAMHALGPAAYAPAATRFFAPAAHPTRAAAAAAPSVYLSDSGAYKVTHLSQIA